MTITAPAMPASEQSTCINEDACGMTKMSINSPKYRIVPRQDGYLVLSRDPTKPKVVSAKPGKRIAYIFSTATEWEYNLFA